jgi:hypothetical protein
LIAGKKPFPARNWDEIAAGQAAELADVLADEDVKKLLTTPAPDENLAREIKAAREFSARYSIEAIKYGYEHGFKKGLENDAHLFGEITASLSGQEWVGRFIDKDPEQSAFLTVLKSKK